MDDIHWIGAPLKQTFAPLSRVGRGPSSKSLICTTLQAGNSEYDDDDDDDDDDYDDDDDDESVICTTVQAGTVEILHL